MVAQATQDPKDPPAPLETLVEMETQVVPVLPPNPPPTFPVTLADQESPVVKVFLETMEPMVAQETTATQEPRDPQAHQEPPESQVEMERQESPVELEAPERGVFVPSIALWTEEFSSKMEHDDKRIKRDRSRTYLFSSLPCDRSASALLFFLIPFLKK
jgi:hypothetical protein